MSVVLAVLAFGSVVAGFIGLPQFWRELLGVSAPFYDFLAPVLGHARMREGLPHSAEWVLMVIAVLVALAGIVLAWWRYGRVAGPGPVAEPERRGWVHRLVSRGYYFDAFYDNVIVRFAGWLSTAVLARWAEVRLARNSIERPGQVGEATGRWLTRLQTGDLQAYVIYALVGLTLVLAWGASRG
jgi:NADH-quinone oxidoreductase subunit L